MYIQEAHPTDLWQLPSNVRDSPDRLYLIELGGRVAFKSPPGPYGFSSEKLREALRGVTAMKG